MPIPKPDPVAPNLVVGGTRVEKLVTVVKPYRTTENFYNDIVSKAKAKRAKSSS